jgi:hypothetical protein
MKNRPNIFRRVRGALVGMSGGWAPTGGICPHKHAIASNADAFAVDARAIQGDTRRAIRELARELMEEGFELTTKESQGEFAIVGGDFFLDDAELRTALVELQQHAVHGQCSLVTSFELVENSSSAHAFSALPQAARVISIDPGELSDEASMRRRRPTKEPGGQAGNSKRDFCS